MIRKFDQWDWSGVSVDRYKDEPGTWVSVTRRCLASSDAMAFEMRYFEVGPGGTTSFERHDHEHVVLVVRGRGRVLLGETWHELAPFDVVHVPSQTPHRFENAGNEPFGIVCTVDRVRDRPELLDAGKVGHAPR